MKTKGRKLLTQPTINNNQPNVLRGLALNFKRNPRLRSRILSMEKYLTDFLYDTYGNVTKEHTISI